MMEPTASMASIGADVEQMNPRFRKKLFVLRTYRLHEKKWYMLAKARTIRRPRRSCSICTDSIAHEIMHDLA